MVGVALEYHHNMSGAVFASLGSGLGSGPYPDTYVRVMYLTYVRVLVVSGLRFVTTLEYFFNVRVISLTVSQCIFNLCQGWGGEGGVTYYGLTHSGRVNTYMMVAQSNDTNH